MNSWIPTRGKEENIFYTGLLQVTLKLRCKAGIVNVWNRRLLRILVWYIFREIEFYGKRSTETVQYLAEVTIFISVNGINFMNLYLVLRMETKTVAAMMINSELVVTFPSDRILSETSRIQSWHLGLPSLPFPFK